MTLCKKDFCQTRHAPITARMVHKIAAVVSDARLAGRAWITLIFAFFAIGAGSHVPHHCRFAAPLGSQRTSTSLVTSIATFCTRRFQPLLIIGLVGNPP